MTKIKCEGLAPYEIHVDQNSYTVGREKVDKDGQPFFSAEKYYGNLRSALMFIAKMQMDRPEAYKIGEYIQQYTDKLNHFTKTITIE